MILQAPLGEQIGLRWVFFPLSRSDPDEVNIPASAPQRLLDQLDTVCRRRLFSPRTVKAYRYWVRQYIRFHDKRHSVPMGAAEVEQFLNHLAVERRVAASTQSQALTPSFSSTRP